MHEINCVTLPQTLQQFLSKGSGNETSTTAAPSTQPPLVLNCVFVSSMHLILLAGVCHVEVGNTCPPSSGVATKEVS